MTPPQSFSTSASYRHLFFLVFLLCAFFSFPALAQPAPSGYNQYKFRGVNTTHNFSRALCGQYTEQYVEGHYGVSGCESTYLITGYAQNAATGAPGDEIIIYGEDVTNLVDGSFFGRWRVELLGDPDGPTAWSMFSGGYLAQVGGEPGIYKYDLQYYDASLGVWADAFMLYIVRVLPITKMWVEATPICQDMAAPTDNKYHFTIKTIPDPTAFMFNTPSYIVDGGLTCTSLPGVNIKFDVAATTPGAVGYSIPCDANFNTTLINNSYKSSLWPTSYTSGGLNPYDFSLPYDLSSTSSPSLRDFLRIGSVDGDRYPAPLYIDVTLTDGIGYRTDYPHPTLGTINTSLVRHVPVIIKAPALPVIASTSVTATPPTIPGPPHAVGVPSPNYDVYDYNVVGDEVWTPTSNPFVAMVGEGTTVGTVRVQNLLKIPAGASLTLKGMRLEFAHGVHALVEKASSPSGHGGTLNVVDGSVLTAYRGCDGTDHATWGGVYLEGSSDPIAPTGGGGLDFWNMSHGKIYIRNSTVSYADVAIRCNGGAGVIAYNSDFINNKMALYANSYHNITSGVEYNRILSMSNSRITLDNNAWFTVPNFIYLADNRGFWANNNKFKNLSGAVIHNCVETYEAGISLEYNEFYDFATAVSSSYIWSTSTARIVGNTFNRNGTAVDIMGGISPLVCNNSFYISPNPPATSGMYYLGTSVLMLSCQNTGALFRGSTGYNVYDNTFRRYGPPLGSSTAPEDYIVGTLQYNTGSDPNQVVKNDFAGVGTAMLSNFVNRSAAGVPEKGLRYLCNKENNVIYDIAVCGNDILDGGIDLQQLTISPGLTGPASAGNKLGGAWNMYNQQQYISYGYKYLVEQPVAWSGWGASIATSHDAYCVFPSTTTGPYSSYRSSISVQANAYTPGLNNPVYLRYAMANANLNYCLTDTLAVNHKDSIYFWASEMNTAYGDLFTACLLIRDSLIDSANNLYDAIATKYSLDTPEVVDFVYGRDLMDILISLRISSRTIEELNSDEIAALEDIRANTKMWAHARSSAWLRMLRGDEIEDTLLYPGLPDSMLQSVTPLGVLTITEFSLGATHGCQYAELLVTSCQASSAPEVDVRGWLINDNSGLFSASDPILNPAGDCSEDVGITQGNYRLKYDDVWKRVPVGSFIVLYNKDENCYNMPDSFTVDSNYVYWVPVGAGSGQTHIEKYDGLAGQNICGYCGDTGTVVYYDDSLWMNTIGLDSLLDGLQVVCPGCSPSHSAAPAFYHGVGYGAESASNGQMQFLPVLKAGAGFGKKYIFNGVNASDLALDSLWATEEADTPGAIPLSVGNVKDVFFNAVVEHTLSLPCCAMGQQQKSARVDKITTSNEEWLVHVYPNPAKMSVKFEFPIAQEVSVRIADVTGRVVGRKTYYNTSTVLFNVRDYPPGLYVYSVTVAEKTQSGKVVIGE